MKLVVFGNDYKLICKILKPTDYRQGPHQGIGAGQKASSAPAPAVIFKVGSCSSYFKEDKLFGGQCVQEKKEEMCPVSRESGTCCILLKLSFWYILRVKAFEKLQTNC